ncbi:MAG: site-2 protease family protein [Planctomycetes bacterium]|nr:site-2 protease family protein [Planctomycetota bacterium]
MPPLPRNSVVLGRVFGIPVVLSHWLLLLAGALVVAGLLSGTSPLWTLAWFVMAMSVVLLHELGHSLVARHHGIGVSCIQLMPLGGVAWMEALPEDSRVETQVALAGPAVNLALALLAAPLLVFGGPLAPLAAWFVWFNLALGVFNLLPAFPMDGGRVLRAQLARKRSWLAATEAAFSVSKALLFVMGVVGLLAGVWVLPFIAVYLWFGGQRELFALRLREAGPGWPFAGFAPPRDPGAGPREAFAGAGAGPFGPSAGAPRRPASEPPAPARRSDGFSDEEIAKLERYKGPLRRDWRESE